MTEHYLTVQEVAERLKVKKTTVYDMIRRGNIKAIKMGKQFRVCADEINHILGENQNTHNNKFIICGQDMLLDLLCEQANNLCDEPYFVRTHLGSYNGLYAMYQGKANAASAHLWDLETDTYNLPFFKRLLPGEDICAFHIAERKVGFYVQKGNPKNILKFTDLFKDNIRFIAREKGSGIRVLTDSLLCKYGINPDFKTFEIAGSHLEAAAAVASGHFDCTIGNQKAAKQTDDIDFIDFKYEKYDIVFKKIDLENPQVRTLISVLQSEHFANMLSAMGGYNISNIGKQIL